VGITKPGGEEKTLFGTVDRSDKEKGRQQKLKCQGNCGPKKVLNSTGKENEAVSVEGEQKGGNQRKSHTNESTYGPTKGYLAPVSDKSF